MLRKVKLYGSLRKKFGRAFTFDINTPAEAIQALCCQIKGFEAYLRGAEAQGITFAIFEGKNNLSLDEIVMDSTEASEIRIAPIIMGSKSGGLFATIIGVALIVAGVALTITGVGSGVGIGLISAGAGLTLGGVAQMLAPSVKQTTAQEQDGNNPSYAFGGAVTTTANGSVNSYIFGKREVGGTVISGGIYAEDIM